MNDQEKAIRKQKKALQKVEDALDEERERTRQLKRTVIESIKETKKSYAIQGSFDVSYRELIRIDGDEIWSMVKNTRVWGEKVMKTFLEKSRKTIVNRYIHNEKIRITAFLDDSGKKVALLISESI